MKRKVDSVFTEIKSLREEYTTAVKKKVEDGRKEAVNNTKSMSTVLDTN